MVASPGHPVLLDTLGRIMKEAERRRGLQRNAKAPAADWEQEGAHEKGMLLDTVSKVALAGGVELSPSFAVLLVGFYGPRRFVSVLVQPSICSEFARETPV
jgi:hypothetical protein